MSQTMGFVIHSDKSPFKSKYVTCPGKNSGVIIYVREHWRVSNNLARSFSKGYETNHA